MHSNDRRGPGALHRRAAGCRIAEGEARLGTLQAEVQAKVQVVLSHLDSLAKREARHAQRRGVPSLMCKGGAWAMRC